MSKMIDRAKTATPATKQFCKCEIASLEKDLLDVDTMAKLFTLWTKEPMPPEWLDECRRVENRGIPLMCIPARKKMFEQQLKMNVLYDKVKGYPCPSTMHASHPRPKKSGQCEVS